MMNKGLVAILIMTVTVFALADTPDEAGMDGPTLARSAIGFLEAEPPNLEMALDRLRDAQEPERLGAMDARALQLAEQALEAGVPEAVPPLVAKAVGDDSSLYGGEVVAVNVGAAVYGAFLIGLVIVFTGAHLLGRQTKKRSIRSQGV
jgi:hypothetical protein